MHDDDPFDIEKLRIDPKDPNLKPKAAGRPKVGKKWQREFVRVPWVWIDQLKTSNRGSTYRLALLLLYEDWRTGGRPIRLTNVGLVGDGITRRSKSRALGELEALGLVQVKGGARKSPTIKLRLIRKGGE
jgi:hypothetical protein